ncbi:hypothetical protein SBA4_20033 [Candidatus Sulfopaludibacter sp. SbA4]|nr:hypothetical protein SBA4_20033 [Candidatus Sulfopaludibacter sp. SbA4]
MTKVLIDVTKGGKNSRVNMSPEEAAELGRNAAASRWEAYYAAHPEKLQARQEREARKGTRPRGRPPKKKARR